MFISVRACRVFAGLTRLLISTIYLESISYCFLIIMGRVNLYMNWHSFSLVSSQELVKYINEYQWSLWPESRSLSAPRPSHNHHAPCSSPAHFQRNRFVHMRVCTRPLWTDNGRHRRQPGDQNIAVPYNRNAREARSSKQSGFDSEFTGWCCRSRFLYPSMTRA